MDVYDSDVKSKLAPKDGSPDPLADQVAELRALFEQEYEENEDLYDKRDYERLMDPNDDWHARRWIIYKGDVKTAFEMLKETMEWRKEIELNDLSFEDFPVEFYQCGCLFWFGRDKKGRIVNYYRCKYFKPMSEIIELYNKFSAFITDQIDKRSLSNGYSLVYDLTDAGVANVEISALKFMIGLKDRFPLGSRSILMTGVSWALQSVLKLSMSLLSPDQAASSKTITLEELNQFIDEDQIPHAMGGTSKANFQLIPANARSSSNFEEFSEDTVQKFAKHIESLTNPDEYEIVPSLEVIR